MKIVQSYWSKPLLMNDNSDAIFRSSGGWFNKILLYASSALSCLKLKEFYGEVEFVTDEYGKTLFCDILELPFTTVRVEMDNINHYNHNLWALGKIYAYSLQEEPFLHVDSDVFIWSAFPTELLQAPIIGQSLETNFIHNIDYFNNIEKLLDHTPRSILLERESTQDIIEVNAGILGGNDINFFQQYTKEAFNMVDKNIDFFNKVENKGAFNMIYEQFLLYCLAKEQGIKVECLLQDDYFILHGLCDIEMAPVLESYTHALGTNKKYRYIGTAIVERLKFEYPYYYKKIIDLISKNYI